MTTIIHGPQGCGKTFHAQALARHFGCARIVDDWNGLDPLQLGVLALTNAPSFAVPAGTRVVAFEAAMDAAGLLNPSRCS